MNPDIIKLIQRLFITILGSGILIAGLVLIFKGISGKINLLIQGAGVKVKLINASPGVLVTLLGGCLIWYSMNDFSIQRKTIVSESNTNIEEQWLENSYKISGDETYIGIIDTIVGKGQNKRFKVEYYTVAPPKKIAIVANEIYGDKKYWKLLAAINTGKGYYDFKNCNENTMIPENSLLEIWKVSIYYNKTSEEILKISSSNKKEGYKLLNEMALNKPSYNPMDLKSQRELVYYFKEMELDLVQTPANLSGGINTLGDLSLKYYGDKDLWTLIKWSNQNKFNASTNGTTLVNEKMGLYILHFIP